MAKIEMITPWEYKLTIFLFKLKGLNLTLNKLGKEKISVRNLLLKKIILDKTAILHNFIDWNAKWNEIH